MAEEQSHIKKTAENWPTLLVALLLGAGSSTGISIASKGEPEDRFTGTQGADLAARVSANERFVYGDYQSEKVRYNYELNILKDRVELLTERVRDLEEERGR